ncbi:acylphosphatase-2-like [Neocloeon triangulifer]|uniref:acylphosphatase-2-like n=1 Tax=Neocloeon triangulifer TaxID=2078957 RepID=UPI00286FA153|nr:acylphosphatase-2-like [Neocloeon triangulifer]
MAGELLAVDFEVFGKVQGVSFRKYALEAAQRLQVCGWCKNTAEGTVQGQLEGPPEKVNLMKEWLQREGSPYSKIERAEFQNEHTVTTANFQTFTSIE